MRDILLVEDDQGDVFLIREAFQACETLCRLTTAESAERALELLIQGARPELILLDLNLPGRDGCELAAEIKGDERFASIPILMLTTSQAESDVERAYQSGVNAFLIKPMDLDHLQLLAARICDFWFGLARLPSSIGRK